MKKVINAIFRRMNERALAQKHRRLAVPVRYCSKKELRSCLLFYVAGSELEKAFEILRQGLPNVRFQRLCFLPKGEYRPQQKEVVCFSQADLGWRGRISNLRLTEILSEKFDLLVDFTSQSNVLTQYVLKNSEAYCIVGRKGKSGAADITLAGVRSEKDFATQLLTLLSEINGCENGKI